MPQLQPYSYYNDLYDSFTIKNSKRVISDIIKYQKSKDKPWERKVRSNIYELYVSFEVVNRALNKKTTIEKRMESDRQKDDFINFTKPPKIKCNFCSKQMDLDDTSFMSWVLDEEYRLLFIFQCNNCNKKRAVYDNWEEIIPKKHLCPNCNIELNKKSETKYDILTINYFCDKCNYIETETLDLKVEDIEKEDQNYEEDRKKFCISEEEANKIKNGIQDFYQWILEVMNWTDPASIAKRKEQEKYRPLENIKKFSITELEEYLSPILTKKWFINFALWKAEINKEIHVYFTVIDKSDKNQKYSSRIRLRKIINESLINTNWFFMNSWSLEEKLWIIQWKLKWVDNNDELLKLIEKDKK